MFIIYVERWILDFPVSAIIEKIVKQGGFRFDVFLESVSVPLMALLNSCYGLASNRPTVKTFKQKLQKIRRRPETYLMHVMAQLEKHAEGLEDLVTERNRELQAEMCKADMLLEEILPA